MLQWNSDFSNPRFLKNPDNSNQKLFTCKLTLDLFHCINFDSSSPISRTNFRFPWRFGKSEIGISLYYINNVKCLYGFGYLPSWRIRKAAQMEAIKHKPTQVANNWPDHSPQIDHVMSRILCGGRAKRDYTDTRGGNFLATFGVLSNFLCCEACEQPCLSNFCRPTLPEQLLFWYSQTHNYFAAISFPESSLPLSSSGAANEDLSQISRGGGLEEILNWALKVMWPSLAMGMKFPDPPLRLGLKYDDPPPPPAAQLIPPLLTLVW